MPCVVASTSQSQHLLQESPSLAPPKEATYRMEVRTAATPQDVLPTTPSTSSTTANTETSPDVNGQTPQSILNPNNNGIEEKKGDTTDDRRRRNARARQREEEERSRREERAQRKSTRNKGGGEVVGNNYVDSTDLRQPRRVRPPIGGVREPFRMPKQSMEHDKQMNLLKIHMVGPKTKDPVLADSAKSKRKEPSVQERRKEGGILEGPEFQADNFASIEDFRPPTTSEREAYEDRDRLMWRDSPSLDPILLEESWVAIRRQNAGAIPVDAMLHRLMVCDYDIDEMLRSIEMELWEELPQPFEPLNIGQRKEFERLLRQTGNSCAKKFRMMQDKFLRTYWLGEIVTYYYKTKKKGCPTAEYNMCACRDRPSPEERHHVSRVECSICTAYLWEGHKRQQHSKMGKPCAVCSLYLKRTNKLRKPAGPLLPEEEKIVRKWREIEEKLQKTRTLQQVLAEMEIERKQQALKQAQLNPDDLPPVPGKRHGRLTPEELVTFSAKVKVTVQPDCPILNPQMNAIRGAMMANFSPEETMKAVEGFQKYGKKWATVACHVGSRSALEIEYFYMQNKIKYRLDYLTSPPSTASPKETKEKEQKPVNSTSASPEPIAPRRKRDSTDPNYIRDEAPPPKSSRKTRSGLVGTVTTNGNAATTV